MLKRIYIFGASGSGTTTLGAELAKRLNIPHFDTDNYLWVKTDPPYQKKVGRQERVERILKDFNSDEMWVCTGSLCDWGDIFITQFDLAVFLYIPSNIRIQRLIKRERERYGNGIDPGGKMHEGFISFINYVSLYDDGDTSIRSRLLHEEWIKKLNCKVLRLEGDMTVEERVNSVLEAIE